MKLVFEGDGDKKVNSWCFMSNAWNPRTKQFPRTIDFWGTHDLYPQVHLSALFALSLDKHNEAKPLGIR